MMKFLTFCADFQKHPQEYKGSASLDLSPSNPDTNGREEIVHNSEVSSFQGLNCMKKLLLLRVTVSLLERCPHFRGVIREGFHCIAAFFLQTLSLCRLKIT